MAEALDQRAWTELSARVHEELAAWRATHPRATLTEIEATVAEATRRWQAQDLRDLVAASPSADLTALPPAARPRCPECGGRWAPRGQHERDVLTPGQPEPLRVRRSYAVCPAWQAGLPPLAEELGLLPGSLSPALAEGVTRLAAWRPCARAAEPLAFFWRVARGPTTVRQQAEAAGPAAVAVQTTAVARLEREAPAPPAGPALPQVSADGAMVPLIGGAWAAVKTLALGTVREPVLAGGAWRVHAADRSSFSRLTDHEACARLATVETHRRGVATAATVVGVTAGSAWLQGFLDHQCPDAVRLLDFPHAVGHLAAAAQATLGPGTAATAAWLEEQARELRTVAPPTVLVALRALPVAGATDPAAAAARDATLGYLTARRAHIQDARFQALGSPGGSGAAERANKLVVEARMKGSGRHRARDHGDSMLALRTVACTDRWGEAWPQIATQLRAQTATRRRHRRQARHPLVAAPPVSAPPTARARGGIPRLRPERAARPHPWRRPLLTGGRARQAALAKD